MADAKDPSSTAPPSSLGSPAAAGAPHGMHPSQQQQQQQQHSQQQHRPPYPGSFPPPPHAYPPSNAPPPTSHAPHAPPTNNSGGPPHSYYAQHPHHPPQRYYDRQHYAHSPRYESPRHAHYRSDYAYPSTAGRAPPPPHPLGPPHAPPHGPPLHGPPQLHGHPGGSHQHPSSQHQQPHDPHGPPSRSSTARPYQPYPQPRGGLAPSKGGAFHRYTPQNRYLPPPPPHHHQGMSHQVMVHSPRGMSHPPPPMPPHLSGVPAAMQMDMPQSRLPPSVVEIKDDSPGTVPVKEEHEDDAAKQHDKPKDGTGEQIDHSGQIDESPHEHDDDKEPKDNSQEKKRKKDGEVDIEKEEEGETATPKKEDRQVQEVNKESSQTGDIMQHMDSGVPESNHPKVDLHVATLDRRPYSHNETAPLEHLSAKRPRSEPNVDDVTPKACGYTHHPSFFPPPPSHHPPHPSQQHMMPYHHPHANLKRPKLGDEYYHSTHDKYDSYKYPQCPPPNMMSPHQLRPIRSPTHQRSFSLESETRQDKPPSRSYEESLRHRPASYSPNSLVSRRSFDFYRRGGGGGIDDDDDRTLSKSHSWNELGHSRSMSWEVPPALSAICSFGQLNSDSLKSPGASLRQQEDDPVDEELPPLPGMGMGMEHAKSFPLAPRPMNKMMDRVVVGEERREREDRREFYRVDQRQYYPRSPMRMDRYYYSRSPTRRERYYDERDRYYEDTRYRKMDGRPMRYEERRGRDEMDMVDRRDPYESRRYRRYDDERHQQRSPPPPSSRDAYFSYPEGTPGGLSSRSFDSRSMGDLDDPMSLLYRPSFSWERGLDMPYDDQQGQGSVLIQLKDQQKIMKALTMRNEIRTIGNPHSAAGLILLLAMPNDRHCLSETLCIIRNNVEVFTATTADINAPAPGRKRPIRVGQLGLRCVYCRMCPNDRVKRAVCFPSSTKRIYRAVIDMKLDHFPCCPYIPPGLKARLEELSAGSTRSTGMTVQYFVKSAKELGMVDMDEGVYIDLKRVGKEQEAPFNPYSVERPLPPPEEAPIPSRAVPQEAASSSAPPNKVQFKPAGKAPAEELDPNIKRFHGKVLLALEDDASFLSPLRCFLRRNVCAFTATAKDIAVRTPTTFSVRVGQVGVGCVHCLAVPPKSRSNRAVCFPFTVARIYQSVADIQRFHLGECKMMPPEVRAEFLQLQSESAKGSRGLATRTYWIDSARKLGLADGPAGMYFSRDPALPPPADDESLDILAQVATNAKTNFKPLVTPEDKPTIADFLYVVMEQLQPCLFTDADRNKRRSKNLGSIGVECKHCAGKIDGRKFFWSSVSAAESNFVSVHSHMMDCKYIPDELKTELARLKALRREQTSRLRTGSQKAFFTRVWNRLHESADNEEESKHSPATKPDDAPVSSNQPETVPAIKSMDANDVTFDNMVLPSSGSQDELRALLESKSTLSSMPSVEEGTKPASNEGSGDSDEIGKSDTDIKMGSSSDSAIAIKSSLSSVAHDLSAVSVSVNSKEGGEQDTEFTEI
ncbi:hypothetical protein HJC23_007174 [Cyclotella cryptica]|uniref:Uncharacterized protein n=1 Tax=Cyclotella cryptica TaxID=29204 RepID=A0ABD3QQR0_9STRA|eukprot:CCRYP_003454-RA/>CCRYP_003454-RA protein AED:0.10 eAED:-0.11 QI:0/-1/0/1/-1/1/1/0/1511